MSFGIFLYREPGGGKEERQAFRAALRRWGWDGSRGSPYLIGTPTGVTVEAYASSLEGRGPFTACSLEVRGFDTDLCRLVLDLARAGRFEISSDADSEAAILTDESQRAEVRAGCPRVMVCTTAEELGAALAGGFGAWQAYRDRVCGGSGEAGARSPHPTVRRAAAPRKSRVTPPKSRRRPTQAARRSGGSAVMPESHSRRGLR